jgi:Tol biopolymer transport system component
MGLRGIGWLVGWWILLASFGLSAQEQAEQALIAFAAQRIETASDYERTVPGIYLLDLADERVTQMISDKITDDLVWTSDGQHLVFSQGNDVFLLNIASRNVVNLSKRDDRIYSKVLSDGRLIASDDAGYLLIDPLSGAVVRKIAFSLENYWQQSWSPNGLYISYSSSEGYAILDTLTGETLSMPDSIIAAWWSPSGRFVVLQNTDYAFFLFDVETGMRSSLEQRPLVWLPDESGFLVRIDGELLRYSLTDDIFSPFTNLNQLVICAEWSPDGSQIVLIAYEPGEGGQYAIYLADTNGENLHLIEMDESIGAVGTVVWQP